MFTTVIDRRVVKGFSWEGWARAERRSVTNPSMDTIRLKFPYTVSAENQFFRETLLGKDVAPEDPNGKRYV